MRPGLISILISLSKAKQRQKREMSKYDTLTSLLIASEFALPNKVVDSFTVCYTYYY